MHYHTPGTLERTSSDMGMLSVSDPRHTKAAEVDGIVPAGTDLLFFLKVEWSAPDIDEISCRDSIAVDVNHAGAVDPEVVRQDVVAAILEGIEIPGNEELSELRRGAS